MTPFVTFLQHETSPRPRAVQRPVHPIQSPGARAPGGPGLGAPKKEKKEEERKKRKKKKRKKKKKRIIIEQKTKFIIFLNGVLRRAV